MGEVKQGLLYPNDFSNLVREGNYLFGSEGMQVWHYGGRSQSIVDLLGTHPRFDEFFDNNGNILIKREDRIDYESLPIKDLIAKLEKRLTPFYELVETSLDSSHRWGFNRHGIEHVRQVTRDALQLLDIVGASDEEKRMAVLIGYTHDIGNLVSRKAHPFVAKPLLSGLLPELDQARRSAVLKGIALHDEGFAAAHMRKIRERVEASGGQLNIDEEIRKYFGRPTLAVIAADKAGAAARSRVTIKDCMGEANGQKLTELDVHYLAAALVKETSFSMEDRSLVLDLSFSPGRLNEQMAELVGINKGLNESRIKLPDGLHRMHRDYGIPHLFSWLSLYSKLMRDRVMVMTQATMSLFPEGLLDEVKVRVTDNDDFDGDGGLVLSMALRRGGLDGADAMMGSLELDERMAQVGLSGEQFKYPVIPAELQAASRYFAGQCEQLALGVSLPQILKIHFFDGALNIEIDRGDGEPERSNSLNYLNLLFRPKSKRRPSNGKM